MAIISSKKFWLLFLFLSPSEISIMCMLVCLLLCHKSLFILIFLFVRLDCFHWSSFKFPDSSAILHLLYSHWVKFSLVIVLFTCTFHLVHFVVFIFLLKFLICWVIVIVFFLKFLSMVFNSLSVLIITTLKFLSPKSSISVYFYWMISFSLYGVTMSFVSIFFACFIYFCY